MDEITVKAFFDELDQIEKNAGIKSYLLGGIAGLKRLWKTGKLPHVEGGLKGAWTRGAEKATQAGKSGLWGGIKGVAGSRYGQMAAIPAAGLGTVYAGSKILGGDKDQQIARAYPY